MKKTLLQQIEEAQVLADQLNNLDFKKPEEDAVFMDNLNRLECLSNELDGQPQMVKPKTQTYLQ